MAIKLIDIYNELREYSSGFHSKNKGQSYIVDSDVLSSDIDIFRKNVLYLCRASSLNKLETGNISRSNLIIIRDEDYDLKALLDRQVNIIECKENISFEDLLKSIKNIFAKDYALLDSSAILLDVLIKEKKIDEIAGISSDLLHNPVIIIDSGYKVLANSDKDDIREHFWLESINRGYCSYEFIAAVKKIGSVKEAPNTNEPFIVICEESPIRKLVSKIIIQGSLVGYVLALESEVSFKNNHYEIIKLLSDVLSQKLKKDPFYRTSDELLYENLIIDVLEGTISDKASLKARAQNIHIPDNLYLLSFEISKYNSSNHRSNYLRQFLEEVLPRHKSIFFDQYVLVILDYEDDFYSNFKNNRDFMNFLEKQNITMSISSKFDHILDLPKIYKQCIDSLDIIGKLNLKGHLHPYEKLKFYHLLHNVDSDRDLLDFCNKKLLSLIHYDNLNSTEYFMTLKTYLGANRNAVQTSKDLYIHRNTINYRLNKIKEISSIDLDDMEEIFMINLSIKLLDFVHYPL